MLVQHLFWSVTVTQLQSAIHKYIVSKLKCSSVSGSVLFPLPAPLNSCRFCPFFCPYLCLTPGHQIYQCRSNPTKMLTVLGNAINEMKLCYSIALA